MKMLLGVVGVLALQAFLVWGYWAVMERTSTRNVVRGLVGAVLVAALVVMWLGFVTLLEGNLPPFPETS
jgi:hypothetical protein